MAGARGRLNCETVRQIDAISDDLYLISGFCRALFQDSDKNPFPWHHAVTGLLADRTVGMTFFPDLCYLAHCASDAQLCPYRQSVQAYPFTENIFGKCPREQWNPDLLLQSCNTVCSQQTDLPVPVTCVCITRDSDIRHKPDLIDRMLLLSFFLTDADCLDDRGFFLHCFHLFLFHTLSRSRI